MNSAVVAVLSIAWLLLAYRLYGSFIARRLVQPDDSRPTPAHRLRDGVDYSPARPLVLFGHHFASIAGAGPIVGPVIAVSAFGFGPTAIWILVGVVVIGAVHDYTTLMLSVRKDGRSIPDLTGGLVGRPARVLFQVFVLVTLVFVIAVFTIAAKNTLISDPRVVLPAFGLIPLAMVFGWLTNRLRLPLLAATAFALALLAGLFWAGMAWPVALHQVSPATLAKIGTPPVELLRLGEATASQVWIAVLALYGFAAASLPVWLLLQPRDYLGYWILAVGMVAGFAGLFITREPVTAPLWIGASSETEGPIWPMLFILVACGAVSGFHSLVSSGTTAKQLDRESHGRPVAFGAMLTEGALAMLALLAVTAGLAWGQGGEAGRPTLQQFMIAGKANPIEAFATGFGVFTRPFMGELGVLFGMTMINAFVLTTLDTSVRLGRFVVTELAGPAVPLLRKRFWATAIVGLAAWALAATGSVTTLWKMFGASNQLVAALAMLVVTVWLAERRRPGAFTLLPAVFMLLTTCGALIWQGWGYATAEPVEWALLVAAAILLALAVYVGASSLKALVCRKAGGSAAGADGNGAAGY
ncbi:MAG TPA: carbon starvation protein A [Polyangia bacterium]|nr:carbon starvation protein A [Polyangia bacterium]